MMQITIILLLLLGSVSYATAEEQNEETQKKETQNVDAQNIDAQNIETLSATLNMYNRLINPPKSDPRVDILPESPATSGVRIFKGTWKAMNHADLSYQAFTDAKKGANLGELGQYDFYYSLEIVPQFTGKFADCHSTPSFLDYLKALFGVSTGTLILVKTDVDYRWTSGSRVSLLTGNSGLLIAGKDAGLSGAAAVSGNGCLFDTTLRPTFPLLQYGGGGQNDHFDDFSFKFIVIGGYTTKLNAVATIVGLFSNFSAAARVVNPLAGPAAAGAESAATAFQTALQSAGTLQNQVSANYSLKAYAPEADGTDKNSVVLITIPALFGNEGSNGNLVIYVRRYGSLVLAKAGPVVKLETVFDNQELSNRQCNPVTIAQGSCNSANNITPIREALAGLLQDIDTGTGTPPPGIDPKTQSQKSST